MSILLLDIYPNGTLRTLISSMAFTPDGGLFFSEKTQAG